MDILSEVLDASLLKATTVRRLVVAEPSRQDVEQGRAALVIVHEGRCFAIVGAERRALLANESLLVVGRQVLELASAPPSSAVVIHCAFSLAVDLPHPFVRQLPAVAHFGSQHLIDRAELGRAVALLDSEVVNAPFGAEFVAARLAEVALVDMLRKWQLEAQMEPNFLGALADSHVRASLESIHSDPQRSWHVDELAAVADLSRAVFADRFHRLVGETPLRYLRSWRLLNARRWLARGGVTVQEIAQRAGYGSANGFSRAFRRFFGDSPSTVRGRAR